MKKWLFFIILIAFTGYANATVPVYNAYSGVAAQCCIPSDSNASCGGTSFTGVVADAPLSGLGTSGSHLVISTAGTWAGNAATSTLASTATALASSPSNCSAGSYTIGINASGTAQGCTALPTFPSGTVVGTSDTQTLTNKRVQPRVNTTANPGTLTINSDTTDLETITAQAQALTIANPSGTPVAGQNLEVRIFSAASQTIAYGNQFRGSNTMSLVTATTGSSKTDYFLFKWNEASNTWDFLGNINGF